MYLMNNKNSGPTHLNVYCVFLKKHYVWFLIIAYIVDESSVCTYLLVSLGIVSTLELMV